MFEEKLEIQQKGLKAYGFSDDDIDKEIEKENREYALALKVQKKEDEEKEEGLVNTIKSYWKDVYNSVQEAKEEAIGTDDQFFVDEYFKRGFGRSVMSLTKQYHGNGGYFDESLQRSLQPEPIGTGYLERFVESLGQITGDILPAIPPTVLGALASRGNAFATGFSGGFVTEGMRATYIEALKRGEVDSVSEWWDIFTQYGLSEAIKGGIVMGAGLAAPGVVTKLGGKSAFLKYGTQYAVFAGLGPALEGRLPTKDELINVGLLMGTFGGLGYGAKKAKDMVMDRVGKSNKTTNEVLDELGQDPGMIADAHSSNITTFRKKIPDGDKAEASFEGVKITKKKKPTEKEILEKENEKVNEKIEFDDPALQDILNTIQQQPKKIPFLDKFKDSRSKFVSQYLDRLHPVYQMQKIYEKTGSVKQTMGAYEQLRIGPGQIGKGMGFLKNTFKFLEPSKNTGDGLLNILQKNNMYNRKSNLEFDIYAKAKRAVELESKGLETGVNIKNAKKSVKKLKNKYETIFREVQRTEREVNQYLVDAGVVSAETLKTIETASKDYVPFARVLEPTEGVGTSTVSVTNPFKRFKGSKRKTYPILETIFMNQLQKIAIAERNFAYNKLIDMVKANPKLFPEVTQVKAQVKGTRISREELEKIVDKPDSLKPEVADGLTVFRKNGQNLSDTEIAVYVNGKKEVWKVGEDITKALSDMTKQESDIIVKSLGPFSKALRIGATLAPDFMVRNFNRDTLSAAIFSRNNFLPFYNSMTGFKSLIFRGDKMYEKFVRSGAMQSMFISMDRNYFMKDVQSAINAGKVHNMIKHPGELLRAGAEMFEVSTRLGEFKMTYNRLKKEQGGSLTDKEILERSGFDARDVTLDFGKMGLKIAWWNRINAFLNAGIQGNLRLYEAFRDRPLATTLRIGAYITTPSVLLWIANHDDERYKQLPRWQKDLFWILITGDGTVEDGDYTVFRIPKPYGPGILFGTGAEKMLDYFLDNDPESMKTFIKEQLDISNNFTGLMPDAIRPAVELQTNYNFFTNAPIVPRYIEGALPDYEYSEYTSTTGRVIGKFISETTNGAYGSPATVDHLISSWTGTLGRYALELSDKILEKAGVIDTPEKPATTLADIPFIKAFVVRNPTGGSEYVERFYKNYNKIKERLNTVNKLIKEQNVEEALKVYSETDIQMLPLIEIAEVMSSQRAFIKAIYYSDMTPIEKRQAIDDMYRSMIELAKNGLEFLEE